MSFIGAINEKLRKFFYTHAGIFEGKRCYIGCSGNFTVEQIISRKCPSAEIYSNDISLYSSALGYMLAKKPFDVEIINSELLWANEFIRRGDKEMVATFLLLLEMLKYGKRSNPYAERMWQTYQVNFEVMLKKTIPKIEKAAENIKIKEYTTIDIFDYYPKPDGVSIGFLPTYVGGYEKLFAKLEESIKWNKPRYELLTDERRETTIGKMAQGEYILYDDKERDMPCIAQVELFGHRTVYIYSNLEFEKGFFRKKINEKIINYKILMPDEEIHADAEVKIKQVNLPTLNHYRNMFLSKKVQPGSGDTCFLFLADGKVFGFLIFVSYLKRGGAKDEIYLLSDFVVPSVRHKRLAKLLLMSAKCTEMRQILNEKAIKDYKSMLTTAFTDKPVSMKYRGVFDLIKKGKGFLNYRGVFEDTSIKEVINLWKKKYEKQ